MGKTAVIIGVTLVALALIAGWQVVSCELANQAFQEDLQDVAAQGGARVGLLPPSSEEDIRNSIIQKAGTHGIVLQPGQITVEKKGTAEAPFFYVAVDYMACVDLAGLSFGLHFNPASRQMY